MMFSQPIRSKTEAIHDVASARFPALGTVCMFSRALHRLYNFALSLVRCDNSGFNFTSGITKPVVSLDSILPFSFIGQ